MSMNQNKINEIELRRFSEMANYFAVIPSKVRYDQRLNSDAIVIYGEIAALCNEEAYTIVDNDYFMPVFNLSKIKINKIINLLVECGHIEIHITTYQGKLFKGSRRIYINDGLLATEMAVKNSLNKLYQFKEVI